MFFIFIFQITDSIKDENNVRSESKPIAAQIQLPNNTEILQVLH